MFSTQRDKKRFYIIATLHLIIIYMMNIQFSSIFFFGTPTLYADKSEKHPDTVFEILIKSITIFPIRQPSFPTRAARANQIFRFPFSMALCGAKLSPSLFNLIWINGKFRTTLDASSWYLLRC
jgi:hypothetical protein